MSESLSIFVFSPFPPDTSGGAKASYEIFKSLSKKNKITVFSYDKFYNAVDIQVICIPFNINANNILLYILKGLMYFINSLIMGIYLGLKNKPDLIYGKHLSIPSLSAAIVASFLRKPLVLHTAGSDIQDSYRKADSGNLLMSFSFVISKLIRKFCLERAKFIIANSNIDYECVRSMGYDNTERVYNGVDVNLFTPNVAARKILRKRLDLDDDFVICYSGSASRQKNLQLLIKLSENFPKFKFMFIGPTQRDLRLLGNIGENCIAIGKINNVEEYLCVADVYIHPSKVEGLSNSILEAMAAGLPVITFPSGDSKYIIKNYENGFIASTIEEFTKYLCEIYSESYLKERLGYNARELMLNHFKWEKTADKVESIFEFVVDQRG